MVRKRPVVSWRTNVTETSSGCFEWNGYRDANGYSRVGGAWGHRAVYEHEIGPIAVGLELDHTCSNPPCVNPDHLEPVTKAEHARRTWERRGKDTLHLGAAYLRTLGMTYAEVAQALGYADKTSAAGAVRAAIRKGLVAEDSVPWAEQLTAQDRDDIIALRAIGVPVREISRWYGIHESQISRVSRGISRRVAA